MTIENFRHLDWDTKFFNFKVGEIKNIDISETELEIGLNSLKDRGYVLIYLFLSNEIQHKLSSYSLKLVDKKITYSKIISKQQFAVENIQKYNLQYPNQDLLNLAIESGVYSRFNVDENIKNEKYHELYKQWIINSVNKKIAKEVLIYNQGSDIAGMITLGEKNNKGDIGIIAVNKDYRGNRIASKLIGSAEKYFANLGYSELQVVTQGNNIPACKLYEKLGFNIEKTEYVYHIWLDK